MSYHHYKFIAKPLIIFLTMLLFVIVTQTSFACTRLLSANNGQAVVVGRTMDWSQEMKTDLFVYPQGIQHDGMTTDNPITWTSHYGSIVATVFDAIATDGINEKGLAAHILWLDEANYQNIAEPYGQSSIKQPVVEPTIWRTAADLTHLVYYFNSSKSFGFIWTDLKNFDLKPGAPVMKLDIDNNPNLLGEVTKNFKLMNS